MTELYTLSLALALSLVCVCIETGVRVVEIVEEKDQAHTAVNEHYQAHRVRGRRSCSLR